MIGERRVLGLIPARGGSRRLPGKHLRGLGGRPLLAWTVEAGLASRHLDRLILSSDDPALMALAEELGAEAPFRRPAALADDMASSEAVVAHAWELFPDYDLLVLLQPTSPFRTAADIDGLLERLVASGAPACVSVTRPAKSPYWCYRERADGILEPLFPEVQKTPPWQLNGALYGVTREAWRAHGRLLPPGTRPWPMPAERSVDIDTELDLALAEVLLQRNGAAPC